MYRIDTKSNRINKIRRKTFVELGFREREHLQKWLANVPSAFGESF